MKGNAIVKNKKLIYLLCAALCVASVLLIALTGFADGRMTGGKTVLTAQLPYGADTASLDRAAFETAVCTALGTDAEIGFTENYVTGFTDLLITVTPAAKLDQAALVNLLAEDYADWGIESLTEYDLGATGSANELWLAVAAVFAAVVVAALLRELFAASGRCFARVAVQAVAAAASLLISLLLLLAARVPLSADILAAAVGSCTVAAFASARITGLYDRLASSAKKGDRDLVAGRACDLGWKTAAASAGVALLLAVGLFAGSSIAKASGDSSLLAWCLPVLVGGCTAQLLAVNLYGDFKKA